MDKRFNNLVLSKIIDYLDIPSISSFSMSNKTIYDKLKKLYPISKRAETLYKWRFDPSQSEEEKIKIIISRVSSGSYCLYCGIKNISSIPKEWVRSFTSLRFSCWLCFYNKNSKNLYTFEDSKTIFQLTPEEISELKNYKSFFSVKYFRKQDLIELAKSKNKFPNLQKKRKYQQFFSF